MAGMLRISLIRSRTLDESPAARDEEPAGVRIDHGDHGAHLVIQKAGKLEELRGRARGHLGIERRVRADGLPDTDPVAREDRHALGFVQLLAVEQLIDTRAIRVEGSSCLRPKLERAAEGVEPVAHHDQLVPFAGTAAVRLRASVHVEAEDRGVRAGRLGEAAHERAETGLVRTETRGGDSHAPLRARPMPGRPTPEVAC